MTTVGIICEYNPLHLGHKKQFDTIRKYFGLDAVIVCAMSGNFVQRGEPAIFDKILLAKAAVNAAIFKPLIEFFTNPTVGGQWK